MLEVGLGISKEKEMDKKVKFGFLFGLLSGVAVTLAVGAWHYYPKHKLDNAMQSCSEKLGISPEGLSEEDMKKYPSKEELEATYTACVNESLR